MQCTSCGGGLEYAGGGAYARCTRCLALYSCEGGSLTAIVVQAPGGGNNPEFNAIFAQQLGFGPPPPGAGAAIPAIHINVNPLENRLKAKAEQKIFSLIIGAVILVVILLVFAGVGIWVYFQAQGGGSASSAPGGGDTVAWDGKSTFTCGGGDNKKIEKVTANIASGPAIKAEGACKLELVDVNITAPVGIEAGASAKVSVTGGSITGSQNSIVAKAAAQVTVNGAKVTGKTQAQGAAKITGVN